MTAPDVRAQAADLIDNAINILHQRGWCQRTFGRGDGTVCLEAALNLAIGKRDIVLSPNERDHPEWWCAHDAIARTTGRRSGARFNDDPRTTFEDVVLTMKQAAASLREPRP